MKKTFTTATAAAALAVGMLTGTAAEAGGRYHRGDDVRDALVVAGVATAVGLAFSQAGYRDYYAPLPPPPAYYPPQPIYVPPPPPVYRAPRQHEIGCQDIVQYDRRGYPHVTGSVHTYEDRFGNISQSQSPYACYQR